MGNHSWAADTRCIFHLPVLWTRTAAGWSHHLCRAMNTPVLFPSLQGRTHIFKIHARSMSVERDIRFELLARLCPNSTGKLNVFISLTSSVYLLCPLAVSAELSLSPRRRDPQRLHGGRNVRYPSAPENRHREGFPGGSEQSHQIVREIQRYPPLHDLQLIPGKVLPVPPKLSGEQKSKCSDSCCVLGS